ncbi:MAG: CoA-binding protein [archaeon]
MRAFFEPKSVAVVGASRDSHKVGYGVMKNLKDGGFFYTHFSRPFRGKIFPVNPNCKELFGLKCYKSLIKIRGVIDLVVIAVPAPLVLKVVKDCVKKKVKGIIIISAGFAEVGNKKLQEGIVNLVKGAKIPLIGPNCLGIINTHTNLNATFAPVSPPKGDVAFVSQSGALADSILDWAVENRYGFSKVVSYGNSADVDVNDILSYLSKDKETKAITLYIEGIKDGRRFMKVAKKCKKPIIVIKAGRTSEGLEAVSSHTGSLAGSFDVYRSAFRQSGVHFAETLQQLFDYAHILSKQPKLKENSVAIVTNGGGCGVLAADYCDMFGLKLAKPSKATFKKIEKKMHPAYSRRNPVDIVGDALPDRYEAAINAMLSDKSVHGLLVIETLQTMTKPVDNAKVIVRARKCFPKKPIVCAFMGGKFTREGKMYLGAHGVPVFKDLERAVRNLRILL